MKAKTIYNRMKLLTEYRRMALEYDGVDFHVEKFHTIIMRINILQELREQEIYNVN